MDEEGAILEALWYRLRYVAGSECIWFIHIYGGLPTTPAVPASGAPRRNLAARGRPRSRRLLLSLAMRGWGYTPLSGLYGSFLCDRDGWVGTMRFYGITD